MIPSFITYRGHFGPSSPGSLPWNMFHFLQKIPQCNIDINYNKDNHDNISIIYVIEHV